MPSTIALGSQGLQVSKLGYGCMGLTTAYGSKLPDEDIVSLLEKVYEQGITFWDTANVYAFPKLSRVFMLQSPLVCQEEILAKAIKKIGRENLQIATKTGIQLKIFPTLKFVPDGSPAFIRKQCEASLTRLGTDYIDLFYLHRIDQNIPIEVSMMEMKKLVEEGKIKYVGLSECSAKTIRRAHKIHPLTAVELEYSLWCRGIEKEVLLTCKELGIGLVAYSPLGRGFFGGAHKQKMEKTDFRQSQERFQNEANHSMYEEVEKIAASKNATPAQLALAWLEAQQDRAAGVVAIPGTTKEKNLLSNVQSLNIDLSLADIAILEKAVSEVEGARYADAGMESTWESDGNVDLSPGEARKLGL
jgi:aryl-alcohol dehydrogenase-like predicted oxidoreductase